MSLTIYVTPSARKSLWVTTEKLDVLEQRVKSFEHCVPKGHQKTVTFDDIPERAGLCCTIIGPPTELRCLGWMTSSDGGTAKAHIMPNDDMGMMVQSIKDVLSF